MCCTCRLGQPLFIWSLAYDLFRFVSGPQLRREQIYRLEQIRLLYKAGQADTSATKHAIERVLNIHGLSRGSRQSLSGAVDRFLDGPVGSEELLELVREVQFAGSGHIQLLRGRSRGPLPNPVHKTQSVPRKEPHGP
jgi:hypothetical protein